MFAFLFQPLLIFLRGGVFVFLGFPGRLRNDTGCDFGQFFHHSLNRTAVLKIFIQFPDPLCDVGVRGDQCIGSLRIFFQGLGHRIFDGAGSSPVQGRIRSGRFEQWSPGGLQRPGTTGLSFRSERSA